MGLIKRFNIYKIPLICYYKLTNNVTHNYILLPSSNINFSNFFNLLNLNLIY